MKTEIQQERNITEVTCRLLFCIFKSIISLWQQRKCEVFHAGNGTKTNGLFSGPQLCTLKPANRLTILVLTSFSMALTSSAALGTSEDDCMDVSKDED